MHITKIVIKNYRGIKHRETIYLSEFTSFIGKNDSGKSIILNAIASFLDIKNFPIIENDFNEIGKSIIIKITFYNEFLKESLLKHLNSKIRKDSGLIDFVENLIINNELIVIKAISNIGKRFDYEKLVIKDFEDEEFSLLYEKTEQELLDIIKKYNIKVPVEGQGKNSKFEKIKYIKKYCHDNNINVIEKEIEDTHKILSLLPSVELFEADYGLKADTSFKTQTVSEIKDFFDKETYNETARLKQVEKDIIDEMNKEADSIKKYMQEYVPINKVELVPNISWKDAIKSVDVNFQMDDDEKIIPMSHKGTGYRRLFMVARFRYLAEKQKGQNIIYLIEEPETFLHPELQYDLLNALLEISENNQVIITTHSPVFAGATNINAIVLCKKEEQSKYYSSLNTSNKREFILNIAEEIGIRPHYNLRDSYEKILFVESKNDIEFYNILCEKVLNKSLKNNEKVLILPFGGGEGNIDSMINIEFFSKSGRTIYVIIDSDKHENKYDKQKKKIEELKNNFNAEGYILQKSCIENYYHPRAFERVYDINEGIFDFFNDNEKVRNAIKNIVKENGLESKNIKEKNNIRVFQEMTKNEWEEVVEKELLEFLKQIIE